MYNTATMIMNSHGNGDVIVHPNHIGLITRENWKSGKVILGTHYYQRWVDLRDYWLRNVKKVESEPEEEEKLVKDKEVEKKPEKKKEGSPKKRARKDEVHQSKRPSVKSPPPPRPPAPPKHRDWFEFNGKEPEFRPIYECIRYGVRMCVLLT